MTPDGDLSKPVDEIEESEESVATGESLNPEQPRNTVVNRSTAPIKMNIRPRGRANRDFMQFLRHSEVEVDEPTHVLNCTEGFTI